MKVFYVIIVAFVNLMQLSNSLKVEMACPVITEENGDIDGINDFEIGNTLCMKKDKLRVPQFGSGNCKKKWMKCETCDSKKEILDAISFVIANDLIDYVDKPYWKKQKKSYKKYCLDRNSTDEF